MNENNKLNNEELQALVKGNFNQILEGFKNFSEIVIPEIPEADAAGRKLLEEAIMEFVQEFEIVRREFAINLMKVALELDKKDGKNKTRQFGFTSGVKAEKETEPAD